MNETLTFLIVLALWVTASLFSSMAIAYILHKRDLDNDDERGG